VRTQVPVAEAPPVQAALAALRRVLTQDLEPDPTTGHRRLRRGVAAERMPSLGDPEMRHGRKTRTRLFTGYKRHVIKLVDADVIVGAMVRPANEPEHEALALSLLGLRKAARGLEIVSLLLIVWGSSGIFMQFEMALSRCWGGQPRGFVRSRVLAFFMTIAGGLRPPPGGIVVLPPSRAPFQSVQIDGRAATLTPQGGAIVRRVPSRVVFR